MGVGIMIMERLVMMSIREERIIRSIRDDVFVLEVLRIG
jgi:hypothetical protein